MMDLLELVPASVWTDAAVLLGGAGLTVLTLLRKRLVRLWNLRDSRPVAVEAGVGSVRILKLDGSVHEGNLTGVPLDDDVLYIGQLDDPGFIPYEDEEEHDADGLDSHVGPGGFVYRDLSA